jgi:hypothetical protein
MKVKAKAAPTEARSKMPPAVSHVGATRRGEGGVLRYRYVVVYEPGTYRINLWDDERLDLMKYPEAKFPKAEAKWKK